MKLAIHHFETVASTHALCIDYANEGADEGTIIIADTQTQGRGQHGRVWQSAVGNIFASLLITPKLHPDAPDVSSYGMLSLFTALSIVKAMEAFQVNSVKLKWPNDGYVAGKKIFGVLVECVDQDLVVSFGVNVNVVPEGVDQPATSMQEVLQSEFDVTEVCHSILKNFWGYYRQWLKGAFNVQTECAGYFYGLQEPLTINGMVGTFTGVADSGALLLTTADNVTHIIVSRVESAYVTAANDDNEDDADIDDEDA